MQVGSLVVGDSIIPLQRGDLMFWGSIFGSQLHYYEFYFYSCNLRYNDAGKEHERVETYSRDHNQTITRTLLDGFELLTDLEKSRYSEKRE